jgi:hypothetical protein
MSPDITFSSTSNSPSDSSSFSCGGRSVQTFRSAISRVGCCARIPPMSNVVRTPICRKSAAMSPPNATINCAWAIQSKIVSRLNGVST